MHSLHQDRSRDHEQAACADRQINTVLGKLWSALKSAFAALAARRRPKRSVNCNYEAIHNGRRSRRDPGRELLHKAPIDTIK